MILPAIKSTLIALLLVLIAGAQVDALKLPAIAAAGVTVNQFAGVSFFASAIVPINSAHGMYESSTVDAFPVRATIGNKAGYILATSAREGMHKVLVNDGKNMVTAGADVGASWGSTTGLAAGFTAAYIRQLGQHWAFMAPVRLIYVPGGWNPVIECGMVYEFR
jgi:hypothetical protein